MNLDHIRKATRDLLIAIGEDPDREGLLETPDRVAKMYAEVCQGYDTPVETVSKLFSIDTDHSEDAIVLVKDIAVYSLCEHHLLPFFGKAHVAYIPKDGRVTGLSKLSRIVDVFAKRLQLQERLTKQYIEALDRLLQPKGVFVILEMEHFCMSMRGVCKPGTLTVTTASTGIFQTNIDLQKNVMMRIQ